MTSEFCPRCGNARTGAFRFCRSCGFDFDEAPVPQAPPASVTPRPPVLQDPVAWPTYPPPEAVATPPAPPAEIPTPAASGTSTAARVVRALIALLVLVVIGGVIQVLGFGGRPSATALPTVSPTPAFDVAAVKAKFVADCKDNVNIGEWFCKPVNLPAMTGEETILIVPTSIDPDAAHARDDGDLICAAFAQGHATPDGADLGYDTIGILDKNGENLFACTVD